MRHKIKQNQKRKEDSSYSCRGHIWIDGKEGTFIGYGRVVLLERIRDHGSISKAAKSMDMSYKHAWDLIDSMNRQAPRPFIITSTGGRGGGGTCLTDDGLKAIRIFWDFHNDFQDFLACEEKKVLAGYDEIIIPGGSDES
jgi:molybdate transport system regulatory protein